MSRLRHYIDVTADTATADWTVYWKPTGYEAVARGSGDTYYIGSSTLNHASAFDCGDGPAPFLGFVAAVTLHFRYRVEDVTGAPDFDVGLLRSGVGIASTTIVPTTSWQDGEFRITTDPATAVRFVAGGLAALGIGVQVTTAPTTGEIQISELWLEVEWVDTPESYDPVGGFEPDAVVGDLDWTSLGLQTVALLADRLQITNAVPTGWRNYTMASRQYGAQYNTEVCTRLSITGTPTVFAHCIACVDDGGHNINLCAFQSLLNRRIGLTTGTADFSDEAAYLASAAVDWTQSHHYRLVVDRDVDMSASSNVRVYVDYDDTPTLDVRYTEFGALFNNVVVWFGSGASEYAAIWTVTTADLTQTWHFIVDVGAAYAINWGDGTFDLFTGTGVLQTHNHNYGAPNTYTILVFIEDPTTLQDMRASTNALVGTLPSLTLNTNINILSVPNNQLTGTIPDPSNNTLLEYYVAWGNLLTGTIPSFAANTALINLYLSDNILSGAIPALTTNVALETLYLYGNQLTGVIPSLTTNTALTIIDAHDNLLSGAIPALTTNVALYYLDLHGNQLTGTIPVLTTNVALAICRLHDNLLTGNIPDLTANIALEDFYCYDNQLTGYVASTIAITLNDFQAQNNALDLASVDQVLTDFTTNAPARPAGGTIALSGGTNAVPTPATFTGAVSALSAWAITANGIVKFWTVTTTIVAQSWTFAVTNGKKYWIDWGDLTVEEFVGNGANQVRLHNYGGPGTYRIVVALELSADLIHVIHPSTSTGTLPNLSSNTALTFFSVSSSEYLSGSIPSLASNTALEIFRVDVNLLTGSIPSLATNTQLQEFEVQTNDLTGSIPDLTTNTALLLFYAQENQLTGSIPSLTTNVNLQYFNVADNQLTGNIPDLTNTALETFYCGSNQLTGYVAATLPTTLVMFRAENNALSLAAVDQILIDFTLGAPGRPPVGTINLSGGTNAVPTPAIKNAAILALPLWTITTN